MTEQKTAFDFEAMRHAIERSDADALITLYAGGAEAKITNKNTPPSHPTALRGKEEISAMLRDVCARDMSHKVEGEVVGEERVAFMEACEYSDGTRVLSAMTLEVRDGKIVRQTSVEAWD
ncbi:MAG: nuclear transport factor 2 family protein [Rubrobacteraceae bacterium]